MSAVLATTVLCSRGTKTRMVAYTRHRSCLACWLLWLLVVAQVLLSTAVGHQASGAATNIISTGGSGVISLIEALPYMQASVPARYCPAGGAIEAGLCYSRCKPGWKGLGCTCFKASRTYSRGCGTKPNTCQAYSYRSPRLPAVTTQEPFSLVLSADPQLFRVVNDYKNAPEALHYNAQLVRSINKVKELKEWSWKAGGGPVLKPRAVVMLGDMTEFYREDEMDAFRQFYDPSFPKGDGASGLPADATANKTAARRQQQQQISTDSAGLGDENQVVQFPTWLMFGNHDYVNNVKDCPGQFKSIDRNVCAKTAVDTMRAVLTPGCDSTTWSAFPRNNVTSFDVDSMAYSFDYNNWHFVVLQYSPSYIESSLNVKASMSWLAQELSAATAQQRRIVLMLHAHRELGLASDPTFSRLVSNSNVVAIFYGHVHVKPWGMTGNFPHTGIPMFNCGASWYHVYCYAEFGPDRLRVAAVVHNETLGTSQPQWFGSSVHALLRQQKLKPVLQQFTMNPNQTLSNSAHTSSTAFIGIRRWLLAVGTATLIALMR